MMEDPGGVDVGETIINILYKKKIIFNKKKRRKANRKESQFWVDYGKGEIDSSPS